MTFTATVSPSTSTGTVTFKDGSTTLGAGTLTSGIATFTTSTLSVAGHSITAVYAGDTNDLSSNSTTLTDTVNQAPASITLLASPNPSIFTQTITLTATVLPSTAGGSITFNDGSTPLGTATLSAGVATLTTSSLSVAAHTLNAVYAGDTNDTSATSSNLAQTVNADPTTTTLTYAPNPATFGQSVTLTASVVPSAATGTITFKDGATALCTAVLANGVATFSTSTLGIGAHNLTATYPGDPNDLPSTSQSAINLTFTSAVTGTIADSTGQGTGFPTRLPGGASVPQNDPNLTLNTSSGLLSLTTASDNSDLLGFPASLVGVTPTGDFTISATFRNVQYSQDSDQLGVFVGTSVSSLFRAGIISSGGPQTQTVETINGIDTNPTLSATLAPNVGDDVTISITRTAGTWAAQIQNRTTPAKSGALGVVQPSDLNGVTGLIAGVFALNTGNTTPKTETLSAVTLTAPAELINQATSTTTLTSSANPSIFGQSVTLTATVSPSTATGSVTFTDGSTTLGSGTIASGVATLALSNFAVGTHTLTATYGGDSNYLTSASAPLSQAVNQAPTTTALISSLNPSNFSQNVTFTATVSAPGATGTVTFLDGSTSIGSGTLTNGTAALTISTLSVTTHSITAVYSGDTSYLGSTSPAISQVVNKATTTTTLTSSLNPATWAQNVTLTATLSRPSATGTVSFFDATTLLGTTTVSAGAAAFTTSSLAAGPHALTAVYSGDASDLASTSSALTQTVNQLVTTTSLASSPNPSTVGQSITLTATVSSSGAAGTVTFHDGSTTLGTGTLNSGVATLATSALATGPHSLTASYAGDSNNTASTSTALSQTVNQIVTTTTLNSSLNPAQFGQPVTLTANVSPTSVIGTVTFLDGAVALGQGTLSGGVATFGTSSLSVGPHSLTAAYNGDTNNATSTSLALTQSIQQATTTTTLTTSANPSNFGSSLTLSALISNAGATGTVTFLDGTTTIGASPVTAGAASFTTSALSVGSHTLTASYSGDTNYTSSTSSAVSQTINQTPTVTILSASPNPSIVGQTVTLAATVSPSSAAGVVTFKDGATTLGTGTLTAGSATLSTAFLTSGPHTLTASYGGDTNDATSASSGLNVSLNFLSSISGTIADSAGNGTGFTTRLPGTGASIPANDPNLTLNAANGALQIGSGATEYIGLPLSSVGVTSSEDFSVSLPLANVQYPNASDQAGIFIGTSSTQAFRGGIANLAGTPSAFTVQTNGSSDSNTLSSTALAPSPGDNIVLILSRAGGVYSLQLNNLTAPTKSGLIPITQPAYLSGVSGLIAGFFGIGPTETLQGFSLTGPGQTVVSAATTTTLISSANPSTGGNGITLTATVSPALATGTITFKDGANTVGTGTLAGGTATFSTSALSVGSHSLTAIYSGDANYNTGTSAPLTQVVNQIVSTTSIGSSSNPGTVGQPVVLSATVSPATATGTITFKDGASTLGTGSLTSGTATLSVSLAFGSHSLTATYSGDANDTGSASSALTQSIIFPPLSILTSNLPAASIGQIYGPIVFAVGGGSGSFTWTSGPLAPGLSFTSSGSLGGTPTASFSGSISITVTDNVSSLSTSVSLPFSVGASPVSVSGPSTLGDVLVGAAVSGSFTASGGLTPYTWSVSGVSGLTIDSNGKVTGAPTAAGSFTVTVGVKDSLGNTANATATLSVLGIATTSLPAASTTAPYTASINVLGGISPFTFTATGLPTGITFSNGTFGGEAKSAGTASIIVTVNDSKGLSVQATYTLNVSGPGPLTVTTASLPSGAAGKLYFQVLGASGGAPAYTWRQSGGVLPSASAWIRTAISPAPPAPPALIHSAWMPPIPPAVKP